MSDITRDIFYNLSSLQEYDNPPTLTDKCTHIITSNLDHGSMTSVYNFKSIHRNVKVLYIINPIKLRDLGIKNTIKLLAEWGFDGIIVDTGSTAVTNRDGQYICKFFKALSILPQPYDFQWKKCIRIHDDIQCVANYFNVEDLNIISPLIHVKQLTDIGVARARIILDSQGTGHLETKLESVKYNKLGGIMTHNNEECLVSFEHLKHTLNIQDNHLDYPTSNVVRQIEIEQKQLNDILDSYSETVLTITLDIDFTTAVVEERNICIFR